MHRRLVSFLVTNNYNSRSYRATLSFTVVRLLILLAGLIIVLFIISLIFGRTGLYRTARLSYLEQRNLQLETEYARVAELRHRLDRLEERERRYAEMLGVELTPPPVDWRDPVVDTSDADGLTDDEDAWGGQPIPTALPVQEFVLSRRYDRDHPAVDLAARSGTPVRSAADGVITARGFDNTFGNYLQITHLEGFETYYAHLRDWQVELGDSVRAGQTVGTVGSTGRSTAPHLHFEIRRHGEKIDPEMLIRFN